MPKIKTKYVCRECGGETPKWQGQCPHCTAWNTLEEEVYTHGSGQNIRSGHSFGITASSGKVENLSDVEAKDYQRISTDIAELDRVLGGGLVHGGVILLGGEPGIGKSTILLQTLANLSKKEKALYVTGEESSQQIALRGRRLKLDYSKIRILSEIELEKIISSIQKEGSKFVVIDSIQTIFSSLIASAPGSVSQVKECSSQLNRFAKENGINIFLVGHITKDGELAGPRVLEHIVDAVLYFEGDKQSQYRAIRAFKNRFGSVNEVGLFMMAQEGLIEVNDPAGIFLSNQSAVAGSCVLVTSEGNRAMLVEVQALLDESPLPNPIRRTLGIDQNRLAMIIAIIHKYLEMNIYGQNVFVSVVGGMKLTDPAVDLAIFLAIISSFKNQPLPEKISAFGEIGLTGELRVVSSFEDRIKESSRLGIKKIFLPKLPDNKGKELSKKYNVELIECKRVHDVLNNLKNL